MAKIIDFILNSIYALDPLRLEAFDPNFASTNPQAPAGLNTDIISNKADKNEAQDKKEKMKKRQNKLLEKMKNKGKKMLQNSKIATSISTKEAEVSQEFQCAFCQEFLSKENFVSSPFGNFTYCQSSKLYYHAAKRTEEG